MAFAPASKASVEKHSEKEVSHTQLRNLAHENEILPLFKQDIFISNMVFTPALWMFGKSREGRFEVCAARRGRETAPEQLLGPSRNN